ncbi:tetratricopeptide repeat protein [Streptomyces sp. AA1529]|uniref:tetratricopeptide repeat protein n=1 Tax=Streptomyces sp. AA1529 TaxID=1203257 RepID=UPI0003619C44|nr:tetratricopeptide repeat protein [Streptomyces sp. AA1529]
MTGSGVRHVLVIGAQCRSMGRLSRLEEAARDLHSVLTDPEVGGCRARYGHHPSLLVGEELEPEDVRRAVHEVTRRATADGAAMVVALLGHGFTTPQQTDLYYMVGSSTTQSTLSAVHVGSLLADAADEVGVDGVIALIDTCHAGGAVPNASRLAGGVRSGRARLAVLTAAAADQEARDMRLTAALTEVLREGISSAGSAIYVDQTLCEALRERISGQAVGRADYDNDPYASEGLWLARNTYRIMGAAGYYLPVLPDLPDLPERRDLQPAVQVFPGAGYATNPYQQAAERAEIEQHMSARRHEQALRSLNRMIDVNPHDAWALAQRGSLNRLTGNYEQALRDLNGALQADRSNTWALAELGAVNRVTGRYGQALSDLQRVLEVDPDNAFALAERGAAYLATWRYEEAARDLNRALEINPYNTFARDLRDQIPDSQLGRRLTLAYEVLKFVDEQRRRNA